MKTISAIVVCPMLVAIAGCSAPPKVVATLPAQKEVVRIGQMRPMDDPYWAFCQPNCEPPTAKSRVQTQQPAPGMATQVTR